MRIYLVDDESMALNYLARLVDWGRMGHVLIGMSTDATVALEACLHERVDLLVSDIRMPKIDGIELSRRLKEQQPTLMVVLLTGYKDFDYARRAIGIHAEAFLLKDELTEKSLSAMLTQCSQKCATLQMKEEHSHQWQLQEILQRGGFARHRPALGVLRLGMFVRVEDFELFPDYGKRYLDHDLDLTRLREAGAKWHAMCLASGTDAFVATWDTPGQESRPLWNEYARMLESEEMLADYLLLTVHPVANANQLEHCYRQCLWASENLVILERRGEIMQLEDELRTVASRQTEEINMDSLQAALRSEDAACAGMALEGVFGALRQNADMAQLRGITFSIIALIEQLQQSAAMPLLRDDENLRNQRFHNLEQMRLFFVEQIERAIRYAQARKRSTPSPALSKAMKWMREHYADNISLVEVADAVPISSVYLSQLFRKHTGTTFSEELAAVRIQAAKHLLEHTNLKVYDIARQVGFQKSQYFAQVFKAHTGQTPLEYRGKSEAGSE